jgi:hypothetical protein
VHSTLLPQQGIPVPPHVPPPHAPFLHAPVPPLHIEPLPTQVRVDLSQQPPLLHPDPSQHGCPGPPHAAHLFMLLHASLGAVQKLPLQDMPFIAPWQHVAPSAPQPEHVPLLLHVPVCVVPQLEPDMMQVPSTQQRLPVQDSPAQHGWAGPPHATSIPSTQVEPPVPWPRARHVPPLQQPPPEHMLPEQHCSPG